MEEEPEDDLEEIEFEEEELDDDTGEDVEGDEDDSDAKSEVINPPYKSRAPVHRWDYNGTIPLWAYDLERWSRHQRQRPPFGMARGYYNLTLGGPTDRALPIMIHRISDIND